ncbi:PQQ-dependent sugar dehydrogenase, partial [Cribrihabitans sp. XS_ASV171]
MKSLATLFLLAWASALPAQTLSTSAGQVRVEEMISGLDVPWAIDFLPDGEVLVTELSGELLIWRDGETRRIDGVPDVWA